MKQTPIKPSDVNDEIWRLIKRCDDVIREIYKAGDEYATTKGNYEDAHAQALLRNTTGTVQEKKANADRDCFGLYKQLLKADVRYKYLKTVLETTRSQLSAAQSVGSNMRDEWAINKQYKP